MTDASRRMIFSFDKTGETTMSKSSVDAIQQLIDKQAVIEVLLGYCRAIDRRDADLMRRVYWPDAIDDHAVFKGTIDAFIAFSFPFLEGVISQHSITNIWIDICAADEAFSECYFQAFHDFPSDGSNRLERIVGGRYLDRHERRGDEWRIATRTLAIDWYHERAGNSIWDTGRYANLENRGGQKPNDPLYRLHPRGAAV